MRRIRWFLVIGDGGPVVWRLPQLITGLFLYGFTLGVALEAGLGLNSWGVLHDGLAGITGLTFGQASMLVGAALMLLWIPLRQTPRLGTFLNVAMVGPSADVGIALVETPESLAMQAAVLAVSIAGNAAATAMYIGAQLGAGPRDGLWVGLSQRTQLSVRVVRTGLEVSILISGFMIGGTVGVGTVLFTFTIGPLVQVFLPPFTRESEDCTKHADSSSNA